MVERYRPSSDAARVWNFKTLAVFVLVLPVAVLVVPFDDGLMEAVAAAGAADVLTSTVGRGVGIGRRWRASILAATGSDMSTIRVQIYL